MSDKLAPSRRALARGALAATAAAALPARAADRRPNILFIMADDLGYADLSCYGRREYQTPNIDRLAREGLKLRQAYANSAVCSATRTALITGRYQYRLKVGLYEPIGDPGSASLPEGFPTLPALFKAAGYRTSLIGKWHLGDIPAHGPLKSGYERFFGIPAGGSDYFRHVYYLDNPTTPFDGLWEDDRRADRPGYLTDLFGDRAAAEIAAYARGDKPFMMSLHFNAPHWPWEGPKDEAVSRALTSLNHRDGGNEATYGEMVKSLDANVGKVLAALDRTGLARNTIVVFTSDNGGERFSNVWPLIGAKGELLEGGIRVPALVRWPGRIAPRSLSDQVIISMDWLPTLAAAAGIATDPATPPDGEDVLAVLTGRAPVRPRKLYWRFKSAEQAAVRDGDWKYLKLGGKEHLFNIAEDERERAEKKAVDPERFARLKADFDAWNATMLAYDPNATSMSTKAAYADRY